jgi:polyferredoxin
MTSDPRAAAVLLMVLAGSAALFALIYQREAWCRYLCPLGTLGAAFTAPGIFQVRANPAVCGTSCKTHECYKGTDSVPGCPVFHHPLFASDAHACRLCLNCLRVCPHGSARLYARLPLRAIWTQLGLSGVLTPFSLSVFFLSLWLLAAQVAGAAPGPMALAAGGLLCVMLGSVSGALLPRLLAADEEAGKDAAARAAFASMVLAWGPLVAYQLAHVPLVGEMVLRARDGSWLGGWSLSLLPALQVIGIVSAALMAAGVLGAVERRLVREGGEPRRWGWALLRGTGVIFTLAALAILLGPKTP